VIHLKGKEALYSQKRFVEEEILLRARSPPYIFLKNYP
jgi:hypothetical protein